MSASKKNLNCKVCKSKKLTTYLELGSLPLANNLGLTQEEAINKDKYTLSVQFCNDCGLSQLSEIVSPDILFGHYTYRSGMSLGYINHCREMAKEFKRKYLLTDASKNFVIDVAGNDCTLLQQFIEEIPNLKTLNIDPAKNLCEICADKKIPAINDFLNNGVANQAVQIHGTAQVIIATNVIAHVENIVEFILAMKTMLKDEGVIILEFPYLLNYIDNLEFDTTYHEHLSYISITPLQRLCDEIGMDIINVEPKDIHGGTVRVTIAHKTAILKREESVSFFIKKEEIGGYNHIGKYKKWAGLVDGLIKSLFTNVTALKQQGYKISAFAASAKGSTLLNSTKIDSSIIDFIYDHTPEKVGKFSPGTGIPIVHPNKIIEHSPDYILILAWNFKDEIIGKVRAMGYKGKFIIPVPYFVIID